MSDDGPELPKYRLRKRPEEDAPKSVEPKSVEPEPEPNEPLGLGEIGEYVSRDVDMSNTDAMLEDAYGKINRKQRREARQRIYLRTLCILSYLCLAISCTLLYAHLFKKWPLLSPAIWYLPFFLSGAVSVWCCLKAIALWKGADRLLTLVGFGLAGIFAYWNVYVLEYASQGERIVPSNAFWAPEDLNDLYLTAEFNRLRGVPFSQEAYTGMTTEEHRRAFNTISSTEWRPYFERYLSSEEMDRLNVENLQTRMHIVVDRIQKQRMDTWLALQQKLKKPTFKFRCLQVFLKPYTWIIENV